MNEDFKTSRRKRTLSKLHSAPVSRTALPALPRIERLTVGDSAVAGTLSGKSEEIGFRSSTNPLNNGSFATSEGNLISFPSRIAQPSLLKTYRASSRGSSAHRNNCSNCDGLPSVCVTKTEGLASLAAASMATLATGVVGVSDGKDTLVVAGGTQGIFELCTKTQCCFMPAASCSIARLTVGPVPYCPFPAGRNGGNSENFGPAERHLHR